MTTTDAILTAEQARTEFLASYEQLKLIEPEVEEHDIHWRNFYYIDPKNRWIPIRLTLHRAKVYGSLELPEGLALMEVDVPAGNVKFVEVGQTGYSSGAKYWPAALLQLRGTLKKAVGDLNAFNDEIERELPVEWRFGKIERRLTWRNAANVASKETIAAARRAVESAAVRAPLPGISVNDYIRFAGIALNAGFPEHGQLPPEEIHRRHADRRHGGMLDLDRDDANAFRVWYESHSWQGAHPFEIAYGTPHGVMFWPRYDEKGVHFLFSVSDEMYEKPSLDMVIALDGADVPFIYNGFSSVEKKLEGKDLLEVGPYRRSGSRFETTSIRLETLRRDRPDSVDQIRWDELPRLRPVTPASQKKIAEFEAYKR